MSKAAPELRPAPVVSPWHHLGIDLLIEPLTPSTHGCRYILTVNNYFTKFVQACAMESKHDNRSCQCTFQGMHLSKEWDIYI